MCNRRMSLSPNFLLIDSSNGHLCLACHDPNRVVTGKQNPLAGWTASIHATATNKIAAQANAGSYPSVVQNACISCHAPHNALGGTRLLRQPNETDCVACHGGGTNMAPAALNVFAEYANPKVGHPFMTGTSVARRGGAQHFEQQPPCHLCGLPQWTCVRPSGVVSRAADDAGFPERSGRRKRDGRNHGDNPNRQSV